MSRIFRVRSADGQCVTGVVAFSTPMGVTSICLLYKLRKRLN